MSDETGERLFRTATAPGVGDDAALPGLETLRAVLDSVPGRVVALDTAFRYVYVNREFLDFMGLAAADVIGREVAQVFGAKIFATYEPVLARLLAGESLRWEGWAMCVGAGLAILLLNVLYRYGATGDRERTAEDEAREYFSEHGRWPDED